MASYPISPGFQLDIQPFRRGDGMYLDVTIQTPWGPLRGQLAVNSETLRRAILSIRKDYAPALYDFVTENSAPVSVMGDSFKRNLTRHVSVGSPSQKAIAGSTTITPTMVGLK